MQSCHQAACAPIQSVTTELILGCLQDNGPIYTKLVFIKIRDNLEGPRTELYPIYTVKKKLPVLASEYKANGFPEGSGAVFLSSIFKLVGLIGKSESQCNLGKRSLASI